MPGVRLDRFLASTAIVLLLSTTAGGAIAAPISDKTIDAAVPAPDGANTPPSTAVDTNQAVAKPTDSATSSATASPAATATPAVPATATGSTDTPTAPASAVSTIPATPANASDSSTAPEPPAAAAAPAVPANTSSSTEASPTPAAAATPANAAPSTGTSETPAPAAAATTAPPADSAVSPPTQPGATTPAATATPNTTPAASVVVDANAPIADQLRELANGKFDRLVGGKRDRMAIDAFYAKRNYAPLWLTDGKVNDRAKAAITYLGHVDEDGLDPSDYPVPDFAKITDPAALAEAELQLSTSVITYAHHAAIGRVHWSRVSADISYTEKAPEPADVLAGIADAKDVAAALDAYEPQDPAYRALKAKLAEIRAGKDNLGKPPIANGSVPKIGAQDDRVPEVRERLGLAADSDTIYDKTLAAAVKKFQQEHELKATGTLTSATIEALNGRQPDKPADIIIANMERWRWMPHDLGKTYVIVNLPDYTLRVMNDGKQVWKTKIVIGKPAMPTPIMTAEMKFITVNPTWNVPPSIVNHEYLPALQQDPTVLERMGLVVSHNPDGSIHIYQPPGDKNALGRIRFNFPNKFLVYQHDTPDKYLFAYDKRAYSHGCMRVLDPVKYAEVLLSLVRPSDGYTEERIKKMYGSSEVNIDFPKFVPVHLTYQTAFVDDEGKLEFRDDIYGRDKTLLAILKGDDRKVADIPIEHKEDISHREVLAIPDQPSLWGGRSYQPGRGFSDGPSFFARLFGGFGASASPPPSPPHPVVKRRKEARSKVKETRSSTTVEQ